MTKNVKRGLIITGALTAAAFIFIAFRKASKKKKLAAVKSSLLGPVESWKKEELLPGGLLVAKTTTSFYKGDGNMISAFEKGQIIGKVDKVVGDRVYVNSNGNYVNLKN